MRFRSVTRSTTRQNGGHQRVLATLLAAVLPEVLEPMAGEADHQQPRRSIKGLYQLGGPLIGDRRL
jgi:hypothetical protein